MEQAFTFIVALIVSLAGALLLLAGLGAQVNDPGMSEKKKKQCLIGNKILYVITVLAILGFLCLDKHGQFVLNVLIMGK